MRNLHDLKSFHENALNEWNATALIMKEAMQGEPDTRTAFVEVLLALSDLAGKDANKRTHLLKAGNIVLHGMTDGKTSPTPPPLPVVPTKTPDRWKTVRRVALTLLVFVLCAASFAGGFALNMPMVISHVPRLTTKTPEPSSTPEDVIRQFIAAAHRQDKPAIIALYHPEVRKRLSGYDVDLDLVEDLYRYNKDAVQPLETSIESVQEETTAKAIITLRIPNTDKTESGTIHLRKFENTWYLVDTQI